MFFGLYNLLHCHFLRPFFSLLLETILFRHATLAFFFVPSVNQIPILVIFLFQFFNVTYFQLIVVRLNIFLLSNLLLPLIKLLGWFLPQSLLLTCQCHFYLLVHFRNSLVHLVFPSLIHEVIHRMPSLSPNLTHFHLFILLHHSLLILWLFFLLDRVLFVSDMLL